MFVLASVVAAHAQTDSLRTRALQEVVVSASRYDQKILETPRSVTVISADVIQNSTYNSVGDLLAKQPGIYLVGANQTPGTNQSLFMRGAASNQAVVMLDGVRITDPSSPNNAIDLSELSLTNVERIEIIEGSHSTVFGGGAIGGVINIITKKSGPTGWSGNGSVQGGTFGQGSASLTTNVGLNHNFKDGWYVNGSLYDQHVAGLHSAIDTARKQFLPPRSSDFRKTDGYAKVGYHDHELDAFASYKVTTQHADIDAGAFSPAQNNFVEFARSQLNYSIRYQVDPRWTIVGNGSMSRSKRTNISDSSLVRAATYDGNYFKGVYKGQLITNEVQLTYHTAHLSGLVGGGAYLEQMNFNTFSYSSPSSVYGPYTAITNYDSLPVHATTSYGFAQASWQGGAQDRAGLSGGVRWSQHSLFGNFVTYDFNPSYRISGSALVYGSLSSGYNAPSLYQLFDPTMGYGAYTNLGNRVLKPEKSTSYEVGLKKEFSGGSYLTTAVYQTATTNLIEFVYLWNQSVSVPRLSYNDYLGETYLNLTRQRVNGAEVSGLWRATQKLSLAGNITWLQGKVTYRPGDVNVAKTGGHLVQLYSNGAFVTGDGTINTLVRRPNVMAFAELKYQVNPAFSASLFYRVAGRRPDSFYDPTLGPFGALNQQPVATYHLIDAGVFYRHRRWISFSAKMENIFNVSYQEILGYHTRGRSGYLRINFTW